VDLEWERTRCL